MRTSLLWLFSLGLLFGQTSGKPSANGGYSAPTGEADYIFWYGQSNAVGIDEPLSTTQPRHDLMFAGGPYHPSDQTAFVALRAIDSVPTQTGSLAREAPVYGFSAQLAALYAADGLSWPDVVGSVWAIGGSDYDALKKGTTPYADAITAATSAFTLYPSYRKTFKVPAIMVVHGEANLGDSFYAGHLAQWQSEFETDINAITGSTAHIPMLHSQAGPDPQNSILNAYLANPTLSILVGPKYMLAPNVAVGCPHFTAQAYRWMGEMYAKTYYRAVVKGQAWSPLRYTSITRNANVITIQLTGQVGLLTTDTTLVSAATNSGFTWTDAGSSTTISSVAIMDATNGVITITLSGTPTAGAHTLSYASTGSNCGPTSGPRGNIRDSDTVVGVDGNPLYNWLVIFTTNVS